MKDLRYKIQNVLNYFVDDVLGIVQNFSNNQAGSIKHPKPEYIDKHSIHSIIVESITWTQQGNVLL